MPCPGWMNEEADVFVDQSSQLLGTSHSCSYLGEEGCSIFSISPVPQPRILLLPVIASALFGSTWQFTKAGEKLW